MCVCGATNILADDLLPNKTLRDTINRILESGNSSTENAGSTFQIQGYYYYYYIIIIIIIIIF
jgi:E3 ubiquitin-protein ligase RBBP6